MLYHNISAGIIMTNQSLVLQRVTRLSAGNYSCIGRNSEGEGISHPFYLDVLCKYFSIQEPTNVIFKKYIYVF